MDRTDDFDSLGDGYWNRTEDFDSLGDGYYTRQEIQELAKLVAREREEQRHVELSTEHLRKWIKCAAPCPPPACSAAACVRASGGRQGSGGCGRRQRGLHSAHAGPSAAHPRGWGGLACPCCLSAGGVQQGQRAWARDVWHRVRGHGHNNRRNACRQAGPGSSAAHARAQTFAATSVQTQRRTRARAFSPPPTCATMASRWWRQSCARKRSKCCSGTSIPVFARARAVHTQISEASTGTHARTHAHTYAHAHATHAPAHICKFITCAGPGMQCVCVCVCLCVC